MDETLAKALAASIGAVITTFAVRASVHLAPPYRSR